MAAAENLCISFFLIFFYYYYSFRPPKKKKNCIWCVREKAERVMLDSNDTKLKNSISEFHKQNALNDWLICTEFFFFFFINSIDCGLILLKEISSKNLVFLFIYLLFFFLLRKSLIQLELPKCTEF